MARVSDDYMACMAISPNGQERKANIYRPNIMAVGEAVEVLRSGRVAWVAPGDVEEVRRLAMMGAG